MPAPALPFGLTAEALAAAMAEPDPDGLAAASRLRAAYGPEQAAGALHQASLRRRARTKFGDAAAGLFFTREGLEQATRPVVADHHAARFRAAGVRRVVDLGCGIGADALAFVRAGLEVVAVESDPATAAVARANLGVRPDGARPRMASAEVICADAEEVAPALLGPGVAAFCDPARRNARGRLWQVSDFTPGWDFVTGLLAGDRVAGVKLGPALPHALVPPGVEAEWVSAGTDTVEVALWAGSGAQAGVDAALLLPAERLAVARPTAARPHPTLPVRPVGRYLYEPDGAVIRARGVAVLGERLGAWSIDPQIAYLSGDELVPTPFAVAFEVLEVLPYDRKALRRWLRDHSVGTLEIKLRGLDVDPAELRRRLGSHGTASATVVLSRTPSGAVALVVKRR
ncbi:class I SAM-dependent methyltransferase [uncultured Friedmanniella sp.]|uniref:class I SAM-dependent methyltransferase n=1 Tax=uncultured Friedmanniella sp. TaxID=335381 RepID=UPI0035CC9EB4